MSKSDGKIDALKGGKYTLVSEQDEVQNQAVFLHVPKKRDLAEGLGGWFIVWQEEILLLAGDKRLNFTDLRVVMVLQAKLDFDNWIRLSLSDISKPIGVARQNVSVSMKKLLDLNVVLPGPSVKNIRTYRLNPAVGWKGTMQQAATERRKALRVINGGKAAETLTVSTDPDQLPLF